MDQQTAKQSEAPVTIVEAQPTLVFGRSSKKRKAYRQRGFEATTPAGEVSTIPPGNPPRRDEGDETSANAQARESAADNGRNSREKGDDNGHDRIKDSAGEPGVDNSNIDAEDEETSVAELIRRRKARKPISGVTFHDEDGPPPSSSTLQARLDQAVDNMELDLASDAMPMGVQFVKQTGMIGQLVNKHMEDYVDAQLAKRYLSETSQSNGGPNRGLGFGSVASAGAGGLPGSGPGTSGAEAREQLAMQGKLHEIDLGAEARARNVVLTKRATQQLRGASRDTDGKDDKPRVGRDGKATSRQRRDSEDRKRDELVEQFLHENRVDADVYTGNNAFSASNATLADGRPADDRLAEQFRREFMEAAAQRMRRKRKPLGPPTKPKPRNEEEILRGPKLGGSRNVRSVIRDKLLQKQEEERHNMPKYEQQLQEQQRRLKRRR
ncbi:hypothetical protein SEPCBS57363_004839 [Sporothrix epigloea]|uniref:mRNA splicing factor RNA helicase n=1 Tax=Sporothrix epigloea TaxID=1892477 RepID=A0ABP0DU78_9PEZI